MREIKFVQHPRDFRYCLSFDLAKNHTGWSFCRWDGDLLTVIGTGVIDMTEAEESAFWLSYHTELTKIFTKFSSWGQFLVLKERMPMQNGRFSSIGALQALAQCHAIFDLVAAQNNAILYDTSGVPAVSEKALFRRLTGIEKVEKTDIRQWILYHTDNQLPQDVSLDITDSIAVTMTLYCHTAEQDILERARELKRKQKQLKSLKRIAELEAERMGILQLLKGE